ncbi:hypothetical protein D6D18_04124 [Aureobasidium pullulans]|nr:hypothetical protein D6D18_04124 [Aureobasidium pullulans]
MHYRQHQSKATTRPCRYCSTKAPTSTLRAESTAMRYGQLQLELCVKTSLRLSRSSYPILPATWSLKETPTITRLFYIGQQSWIIELSLIAVLTSAPKSMLRTSMARLHYTMLLRLGILT